MEELGGIVRCTSESPACCWYDVYGIKVSCGSGLSSDLSQAAQTDRHDLVTQCHTALLVRRAWAIPAVAIGWLLVTGFLAVWVHNEQSKKKAASA